MKRFLAVFAAGLLTSACSDELHLESQEGDLALTYSCSAFQAMAQGEAEFDLLEELAMTAYRHAMASGRSAEAANLPSLREARRFAELEQAVVDYFCRNRDAIASARPPIIRFPISVDSTAPNFSLPMLVEGRDGAITEGDRLSLGSLRGRVVVLHTLATWCPPCLTEHRDLIEYLPRAPEGVAFVGMITKDVPERAIAWLKDNGGLPFPVLVDHRDRTAYRYGITALPHLYVIDRDGRVVYHQRGEAGIDRLDAVLTTYAAAGL